MNPRQTTLALAVATVIGGTSLGAGAALTTSAVLNFNTGSSSTTGTPPASGSWFSMLVADTDSDYYSDANVYTPISQHNGLHIGVTQSASGSHGSSPGCNPTHAACTGAGGPGENPDIDSPWDFFGNTGMHQTTSPVTVVTDNGTTKTLDFSGWGLIWNCVPGIPIGDPANFPSDTDLATITCSTASCSASSTFTLEYTGHWELGNPSNIEGTLYGLHLEGVIPTAAVPVPAALWLFGSGLAGLAGVTRRRKKR